jgi:cell pole-organizing protein PopZ
MLKDWLDTHLHAIVEAKVEAALERVARLAR